MCASEGVLARRAEWNAVLAQLLWTAVNDCGPLFRRFTNLNPKPNPTSPNPITFGIAELRNDGPVPFQNTEFLAPVWNSCFRWRSEDFYLGCPVIFCRSSTPRVEFNFLPQLLKSHAFCYQRCCEKDGQIGRTICITVRIVLYTSILSLIKKIIIRGLRVLWDPRDPVWLRFCTFTRLCNI